MLCKPAKRNRPSLPKLIPLLLLCLLALPLLGIIVAGPNAALAAPLSAKPTKTPKKGSGSSSASAYDVIAIVNQVRLSRGLAPFEVNAALMASAQAHSDYMAATGSISHTGSGGSSPGSRAAVAGFGGSVVENIYGGMNATPQQVVGWWQGDSLHLNTLLSTRHTYAGAGVASAGGVLYYTLDVGASSGGSSSPSNPSGVSTTSASGAAALAPATAVAFNPVLIATPNPDGSVVHVVQAGQTLWTIAATYKIPLADLLQLNGFTANTFIYPGNKVLIKPASAGSALRASPVVSETLAISATQIAQAITPVSLDGATSTQPSPTSTPLLPAGALATPTANLNPTNPAALVEQPAARSGLPTPRRAASGPDPLLLLVAGLVIGGTALLVVGNILKRGGA